MVNKFMSSVPNGYNGELESEDYFNCPKCGCVSIDDVKFVDIPKQLP